MSSSVQVALDLYPSTLARGGAESAKVRSILADGRLLVLGMPATSASPPTVILDSAIDSVLGSHKAGYTFGVDGGELVKVTPGRGCRCGAGTLVRYDPWPGRRRVRVPVTAWS